MNASLLTADRGTHLKIALIAAMAALAMLWAGLACRPAVTATGRSVGTVSPAIVAGHAQPARCFDGVAA